MKELDKHTYIIVVLILLILLIIFLPFKVKAEDFYQGSYITYYQDVDLQTQHLGAYGVYFVNSTAYDTNTSNFRDTWFYTTHLDTTNIQGGSINIPFTLSYLPPEYTIYNAANVEYCNKFICSQTNSNGTCATYTCDGYTTRYPTNTEREYYNATQTLIIRCYYNGTTTFTPGRIEGSNVVCPVQPNANYLVGIRIFHRVLGRTTFAYQLGLASGITTYTNATQQIIEQQQQTNNNLTDSSTNSDTENNTAISGLESNMATNGTIQSIAVMPITLFQSMLNSINGSCTPFHMGDLLGVAVDFPCVDLSNYLGSTLWGVIDVLCCGMFIWAMSNKLRKVWDDFTNLKYKDQVGDL